MKIAVDTNLVLRNAHKTDPQKQRAALFLQGLINQGSELCIPWQVIQEFWVVATRPVNVNGLGLPPFEVRKMVEEVLKGYTLLPDPIGIGPQWLHLCSSYSVCGRMAHDARLVAWMIGHGIKRLATLNTADFRRYPEIECLSPK